MVEAILHAGARSVVATLAPVSDRSTGAFMRRFYAEGVPDDPVERLALTQRSILGSDPREWAAFAVWS
ncbi:MAG: CHAT domain-containing protein [Thermoanaerobaculia bacterium]